METALQSFLDELKVSTSPTCNLLKLEIQENFSYKSFFDQSIREYSISSNLIDFLSIYFSDDIFSGSDSIEFTENDRVNSDFKLLFEYLFKLVYYVVVLYFLFFSLPTTNLKPPSKFKAFKVVSSSIFCFDQSYVYFKVFLPLEDCEADFMYKSSSDNNIVFKKNNLYVIPFTICNNISSIRGRHIIFEFSS
jgi:hypothetical protein